VSDFFKLSGLIGHIFRLFKLDWLDGMQRRRVKQGLEGVQKRENTRLE
jgi:hypothetical protein